MVQIQGRLRLRCTTVELEGGNYSEFPPEETFKAFDIAATGAAHVIFECRDDAGHHVAFDLCRNHDPEGDDWVLQHPGSHELVINIPAAQAVRREVGDFLERRKPTFPQDALPRRY